jgi:hypothetical protein
MMAEKVWYDKGPLAVGVDQNTGELSVRFDQSRWPENGFLRSGLSADAMGLPVYCWRDARSWMPRAAFIFWEAAPGAGTPADPSEAKFVHVRGDYGLRGQWLAWLLAFFLCPIGGFYFYHAYVAFFLARPDRMDVVGGVILFAPAITLVILGLVRFSRLAADWTTKSLVWAGMNVEVTCRHWDNLESFQVIEAGQLYGSLASIEYFAGERETKVAILAYFGSEEEALEVSRSSFDAAAVHTIRQTLSREFIENRRSHFDRLSAVPARGSPKSGAPAVAAVPSFSDRLPTSVPD